MNAFLSLIKLQLKNKNDLSFAKQKKTLIRAIVFGLLLFIAVAGVTFLFLTLFGGTSPIIKLLTPFEFGDLLIVFIVIYFILDLFGTSFELMKSLYLAEDNKLLVTYPTSAGNLFLSKIIVYLVFELRKSLKILIPVMFGFVLALLTSPSLTLTGTVARISLATIPAMIIPIILYNILVVILASLLSVPFLYVYSFLKRNPLIQLILTVLLVTAAIVLCVYLINLIPQSIIISDWLITAKNAIKNFINKFSDFPLVYPFKTLVSMFLGEEISYGLYRLNWVMLVKFAASLGIIAALCALVYFAIKPFYFHFMTTGSEFDGAAKHKNKTNRRLSKYITFSNKELTISFRDVEISGSYISIYILVPILLMFIDAIYGAISKDLSGQTMTYAFNMLLILTPLLASNSIIATLYSKEGRAAYIKKTKPINPLVPLASKLIFNLALSIPSIIGCGVIFGRFSGLKFINVLFLCLSVLFIQYAHIFYCASLDIMNPLNEQYATDGTLASNPNENRATITGFIFAILSALVFYLLIAESNRIHLTLDIGFLKIFLISLVAVAASLYLFIKKIKAFYYEK